MVERTASLRQRSNIVTIIAVLAALSFNNWLLGPFLNHHLFAANGSVSEFSAIDQPHYLFFRTLDILSGLLFVLLALLLSQYMKHKDQWRHILIWGLAVLGVANVMDAAFTLRCSETLDTGCNIPVYVSFHHLQLPSHAYSSVIIALCYFVVPLAGVIYGYSKKLKFLTLFSVIATLVALASFASAVSGYLTNHSFSVRTSGLSQEVQMAIMGIWLVAWVIDVCRPIVRLRRRSSDNS